MEIKMVKKEQETLFRQILALIKAGVEAKEEIFEALALREFRFQYQANDAYRKYCQIKGVDPDNVNRWEDIPAFPSWGFKQNIVASFPLDKAVQALLTTGTTFPDFRGKIFRDEMGQTLVLNANQVVTKAFLFPDVERMRILILAPSPETVPSMGMAIGLNQTRILFGTEDSAFLISKTGLNVRKLIEGIKQAEESGQPLALIGATSVFIYFFNACERKHLRFRLPEKSRICDGGGYQGRFGVFTREEYLERCQEYLGVEPEHCVNTLGLAETATNFFDTCLRDHWTGRTPRKPGTKAVLPWTRVRVVHTGTLEPLPREEIGLLQHYDLANLPTVLALQTDDLGRLVEGGFEIIGRAKMERKRISPVPSERPVGPMGEKKIFRLLDAYMRFSINWQLSRLAKKERKIATGTSPSEEVSSCPDIIDDMIAKPSKKRAKPKSSPNTD